MKVDAFLATAGHLRFGRESEGKEMEAVDGDL